jgi:hypothetical protein
MLANRCSLENSFRAEWAVAFFSLGIGERPLRDERSKLCRSDRFALEVRRTFEVAAFNPGQDQS